MVPGILDMQIRRVWKNWRAITEDGQPILGPSPIPNVYLALGFAGLGVTLSVGVALETVKLLKGEDTYALGDLGIGRFA